MKLSRSQDFFFDSGLTGMVFISARRLENWRSDGLTTVSNRATMLDSRGGDAPWAGAS
jgi:hypothetical protein